LSPIEDREKPSNLEIALKFYWHIYCIEVIQKEKLYG
jgi:hypothetical protein